MPSPANRCPSCGAEHVTDSSGGFFPKCKVIEASAGGRTSLNTTSNPGRDHSDATEASIPNADESTKTFGRVGQGASSHDVAGRKAALLPDPNVRYFGDYLWERERTQGGMGVVYRIRQVSLNRPAALKMVTAGLLADEAELRRFQNEAEDELLPGVGPATPPAFDLTVDQSDGVGNLLIEKASEGHQDDRGALAKSFERSPRWN